MGVFPLYSFLLMLESEQASKQASRRTSKRASGKAEWYKSEAADADAERKRKTRTRTTLGCMDEGTNEITIHVFLYNVSVFLGGGRRMLLLLLFFSSISFLISPISHSIQKKKKKHIEKKTTRGFSGATIATLVD